MNKRQRREKKQSKMRSAGMYMRLHLLPAGHVWTRRSFRNGNPQWPIQYMDVDKTTMRFYRRIHYSSTDFTCGCATVRGKKATPVRLRQPPTRYT